MPQNVSAAAFRAGELPTGRLPVLFTTDWCGHCRRFLPYYARFSDAWIVDISDDDDPLWDEFGIRVVPTVLLFEGGKPVARWEGVLHVKHAEEIAKRIEG